MSSSSGMLSAPRLQPYSATVTVGNGAMLPVHHRAAAILPTSTSPLHLKNILICPPLVKNLLSVRRLTRDNNVSVEFDPDGFSIKDPPTKEEILRCNSAGDLYPLHPPQHHSLTISAAPTVSLWHEGPGHPGSPALSQILQHFDFTCNKATNQACHAYRMGKHTRLPFSDSNSHSYFPFQLLHSDAEALATATFLINQHPCRATGTTTPHELLLGAPPRYDDLRVFGCHCYPNTTATAAHKLSTRSTACVFIGYPTDHRGYRCYDLSSGRVITSRHVVFDERSFPFRDANDVPPPRTTPPAHAPLDVDLPPHPNRSIRHRRVASRVPSRVTTNAYRTDSCYTTPERTAAQHPMTTRSRAGVTTSLHPKYADYAMATAAAPAAVTISPVPTSVRQALRDSNWLAAMQHEFPRWVVRGFNQRPGVDFSETFSPVVKPATIRTVLTLVAMHGWPAHQLDVSNAFLHGNLREQVYCQQPTGFADPAQPDAVCLLSRSLYGLRQAPRVWFEHFTKHVLSLGFVQSKADTSLFVLNSGSGVAYLLLYVDDMILSASTPTVLQRIVTQLRQAFAVKDMGLLRYFLGTEVQRDHNGFFLKQAKYASELLERARMENCKLATTPTDTKSKPSNEDGVLITDASTYRSLAGALQYLTLTRPDIAYAVQQVCLHMHAPRDVHLTMLKRVLRYIKGTIHLGIQLAPVTTASVTAYSDADWAGCPDTR
ncbi:hypothetical protein U9M48_018781 [Paspalum notatum var. saurae]|uniref:Reverse transcriptase Ty1/copia-type domain-containing protein n=1 Tax=Paspalum notatum var. saurae TaxID=547442 RepID=A0AAQ3TAR1_PASNO